MTKYVYIISMGFSGSTVLNLSLGCHPDLVGIGEAVNIVNAKKKDFTSSEFKSMLCSCGQDMENCFFWNKALRDFPECAVENRHEKLIKHFYSVFGSSKIPVDSSKTSYAYLENIISRFKGDLHVVFLVRDFRGYSFSRNSVKGGNLFTWCFRWMRENQRIEKWLKTNKINYLNMGYEELAIYPSIMLEKLCDFIGIDYYKNMNYPSKSSSHIISGNAMRADPNKLKGIFYDYRWFTSFYHLILSPFFLPLYTMNNRLVYSNFIRGKAHTYGKKQKDFLVFSNAEKLKAARLLRNEKK